MRDQSASKSDSGAASIGSKAYWAPECFRNDKVTTESIDLWALGVLVYIMLVVCPYPCFVMILIGSTYN